MKRKGKNTIFLISLLFAWIVAPLAADETTTASAGKKGITIGFRLHGGLNHLQGRDANNGVAGYYEIWKADAADSGAPVSGEFKQLHSGWEGGADLLIHFGRRFGLALGTEYVRASQESNLELGAPMSGKISFKPELTAMPLKLGLFFEVPLARKISLFLQAGAGYYWSRFFFDISASWAPYLYVPNISRWDAKAAGLGYHAALALEIRLARKLFLFLEAQGRYVKIDGFEGKHEEWDAGYLNDSERGTLYYYKWRWTLGDYSRFYVAETPPSGSDILDVRQAEMDLSGFSLRTGLRLHL